MNLTELINTADIFVVLIIVLFAAYGWRRGFMRSIIGLLSLAASIVLAYILRPVISDLLNASPLHNMVLGSISERLNSSAAEKTALLPKVIQSAAESGKNALTSGIAAQLTGFVINIISFILVLVAARLIILVAARILKTAAKLPVIGLADKAAGMFVGVVKAVVIVYVIFAVIGAAVPTTDNNYLIYTIENSMLAKSMYVQNPICEFLSGGMNSSES